MNTLSLMPGARVAPARAVLRGRSVQGAAPRPRAVVRGRRLHARADSEPAKPTVPPVLLNTVPAPAPVHVTCGATLRLPPCRATANRHAAFALSPAGLARLRRLSALAWPHGGSAARGAIAHALRQPLIAQDTPN